ncbi:MAG: hypothetical protein CMH53_07635, partial [Myxococcales bacterium]|nr:hypothetical protein [Myxococcales bacterium]
MLSTKFRPTLAMTLCGLMLASCSDNKNAQPIDLSALSVGLSEPDSQGYKAEVRWTESGVPHVIADTLDSAIFGQAYGNATLNICTLADIVVMAKSQRASYLGEGENGQWLESDFAHLALGVRARAEASWGQLSHRARRALIAYAAGTNHYLATT